MMSHETSFSNVCHFPGTAFSNLNRLLYEFKTQCEYTLLHESLDSPNVFKLTIKLDNDCVTKFEYTNLFFD